MSNVRQKPAGVQDPIRKGRPGLMLRSLDGQVRVPTKAKTLAALKRWAQGREFKVVQRGGHFFLAAGHVIFEIVEPRP